MKAVILAGGRGSRISEESHLRPKPLIEIGDRPILWHILKVYAHYGVTEFVICSGYKGYMIKEYFANYFLHSADVTFDIAENSMTVHHRKCESWKVTVVDTGMETMTGGRIKRIAPFIGDEDFCLTYGDGIGDVDVAASIDFHKRHGKKATVTAVQPQGRFGLLDVLDNGEVAGFVEKPIESGRWVNAGYFVLSPGIFEYIDNDATIWEHTALESLAKDGELRARPHGGFWHAMDTVRDKAHLEALWDKGDAPWKIWE